MKRRNYKKAKGRKTSCISADCFMVSDANATKSRISSFRCISCKESFCSNARISSVNRFVRSVFPVKLVPSVYVKRYYTVWRYIAIFLQEIANSAVHYRVNGINLKASCKKGKRNDDRNYQPSSSKTSG